MVILKGSKQKMVTDYQIHKNDCGSSEVQIALLSANINRLTIHLKNHTRDTHTRFGLLRMVNTRRRLLRYLKDKKNLRYAALLKKLSVVY
jgi:small subunit ribosomal protein S15